MAAYGSQNFENIYTTQWLLKLEQTHDLSLIIQTLSAIDLEDEDSLTLSNCYRAILAAEVLAALKGRPAPNLPEIVQKWIEGREAPISKDIINVAVETLNNIVVRSRLKDQWMRTGELENRKKSMAALHFRLTEKNGHSRPRKQKKKWWQI